MGAPKALLDAVRSAPAGEHGSVFRRTGSHPVGGLRSAGNAAGTELWLVVSANGRGLFDAVGGQRVARDPTPVSSGPVRGIGPLAGRDVEVAGIDGGRLPRQTADGWQVTFDERAGLWLTTPAGAIEVLRVRIEEARVLGFSHDGGYFVVADAATLVTFARAT